jgi:hypothetical protein
MLATISEEMSVNRLVKPSAQTVRLTPGHPRFNGGGPPSGRERPSGDPAGAGSVAGRRGKILDQSKEYIASSVPKKTSVMFLMWDD